MSDAATYFSSGADKIIVNTLLWTDPSVVRDAIQTYGSQAVIASIDYSLVNGRRQLFSHNNSAGPGERRDLADCLGAVADLGVGEMLVNSVNQDGTGMGLDLSVIEQVPNEISAPIILMGGVGRTDHFAPGLKIDRVSGVATSNLFAFIGDGLEAARRSVLEAGINIAVWR
jgi:cyclase